MAITFPLAFPTATGIQEIEWIPENSVATTESPWSKKIKVYDNGGKRWRANITLPSMTVANGRIWRAWFLALNGMEGTFWLSPTLDKTARGIATGTPLVNGGSQTGQSLVTDGWTTSQTGILKAGDWFQLGNYLYQVMQDANSDGSGNATFDIWPSLRSSPSDNDALILTNPKGLFRLASLPPVNMTVNHLVEGLQFQAIEAI